MTICIATPEYTSPVGGVGTFYRNLVPFLLDDGNTVIVVTIATSTKLAEDVETRKDDFILVELHKTYFHYYNEFKKHASQDAFYVVSNLASAYAIRQWLSENADKYKIDVVETVDANGWGAFFLGNLLPPVVICGHGTLFQTSRYNFTIRDKRYKTIVYYEMLALKHADLTITHSQLNKVDLEDATGQLVQFATAPILKPPVRSQKPNSYSFLVAGRLEAFKGIKVLVDALVKIKDRREIKVLWVGNDTHTAPWGSLWAKYLQRNYTSIWGESLIYTPGISTEEMNALMQNTQVVVVPSLWETFGYSAIEAAAAGKKIVLSDNIGAARQLKEYEGAFFFKSGNADELAQLLTRCADTLITQTIEKTSSLNYAANKQLVVKERIAGYKNAIEIRKKRSSVPDFVKHKEVFNLKLSLFHYFRKTVYKGLSYLRIPQI